MKAYEKAIELQPEFFDALYNLGALHFNRGLMMLQEAEDRLRETQDFAQYEEDEKEIRENWKNDTTVPGRSIRADRRRP